MFGNTKFIFNGITSDSMGLQLVQINSNKNTDNQIGNRTIVSERTYFGNDSNYFFLGLKKEILKFKAEFLCEEGLTQEKIRKIYQTFFLEGFAEFIPMDTMRVYNVVAVSGSLNIYGNSGFFSIDFESDSDCSYSQWRRDIFDFSTISSPTTFKINNAGDLPIYCNFQIVVKETGQTIRITNLTNEGKHVGFQTDSSGNQLQANEEITIDMKKNRIYTTALGVYRYSNLESESEFFQLVRGINTLLVSNKCLIIANYRFQYLT